jgi:hypothetical protein
MVLLIIVKPACHDGFEKEMRMVWYYKQIGDCDWDYFLKTSRATLTADIARGHPA